MRFESAVRSALVLTATLFAGEHLAEQVRAQGTLHVTPDGKADAAGDRASPLSIRAAIDRLAASAASERDRDEKRPREIVVHGGRYPLRSALELDARCSGRDGQPVRIRAARGERPIFDGAAQIDPAAFAPVTEPSERRRLAAEAVDSIVVQTIDDAQLVRRLRQELVLGLVIDGETFFPSRFPNEGYAQLEAKAIVAEVSPPAVPVGKQAYGVRAGHAPYREAGRPQGWLGSLTELRGAHASIGAGGDAMAGTWQQWQAELARDNRRHRLTGFLDANWLQKSQSIVAADAASQTIHLSQALAYGWAWRGPDKPFFVYGMLCELDAPGEWHFDAATGRLFLYPPGPIDSIGSIKIPLADGFLRLRDAHHVEVTGLVVENIARGTAFHLDGGSHNRIAACVARRSTACGVRMSGTSQRVVGCDFVDLDHHVVLDGGSRGPDHIAPGHNLVENCHIYQRHVRHRRVGISIRGVGNTFRNNLVHHSLGQAITVHGNDHVVERNELFNIGFDEGDGGAIYAGADLTGYGVVYRHNFIHHLMHVPGKVERSGIHLDDLQAGATCIGNVFYKSAGKGIFMNGGAGHRLEGNVFLSGFRGIYNVGHGAQKSFDRQAAIDADPDPDRKNTKENYVGRAERIVGPQGWSKEPWRSRYPRFDEVMRDAGKFGRFWPIRCSVVDNLYYGNARGDHTIWSRVAPEARAKSRIEGDRVLRPDAFVDFDALDLRFRGSQEDLPDIPFEAIGLRLDEFRSAMPDKAHYRAAVRRFFDGIPCMPGTTRKLNSGALVEDGPIRRRR